MLFQHHTPLTPRRFTRAMIPAVYGQLARSDCSAPIGLKLGRILQRPRHCNRCVWYLVRVGGLLIYSAIVATQDEHLRRLLRSRSTRYEAAR